MSWVRRWFSKLLPSLFTYELLANAVMAVTEVSAASMEPSWSQTCGTGGSCILGQGITVSNLFGGPGWSRTG